MNENLYDARLFADFFEEQPQALVWLQPKRSDQGIITDFTFTYANKKGIEYLNFSAEALQTITIHNTPSLPSNMKMSIFHELVEVYETGKTSETSFYNPIINKYVRVFRTKFRNGVLNIIQDSTKENRVIVELGEQTKELQQERSFTNSILDASPNGIFAIEAIFGDNEQIVDFKILKINKAFTKIIGMVPEEIEGKSYLCLFPGSKQAGAFDLNCQVIRTGIASRKEMYYGADGLNAWFDISIVKWGENGLVITFSDITDRKKADLEREENNKLIQTMLNASFHGKALLEPTRDDDGVITDFRIVAANTSTEKQLGIKPADAVGKTMSQLLPAYKKNGGFDNYKEVLETGKSRRYEQFYQDERFTGWFDIFTAPVNNGIVISFANVTEQKQEALRIQQQKNLLDAILAHSPSGISVTQVIRDEQNKIIDGRTILANKAAISYSGITEDLYLSKTAKELDPTVMESPLYELMVDIMKTGEPFHTQYFLQPTKRWLELAVAKMDEDHAISVFSDITASKEIQLQVEHFAEKLNTVISTSQAGFFIGSPVYDETGEIIDFRFTLVNQAMASFVGKQPEELIGQLASDWFVTYKKNGLFEQFRNAYLTRERLQFDVHYSGETIEVWANVMTTRFEDELLGSFTDFTPLKQLQLQLQKSVEELKRSNANLEEFAYAASHDLQEPLRKINLYADQLRRNLKLQLSDDNIKKFDRMQQAVHRMQNLINNLLEYSKVSFKPDVYEDVELDSLVDQVLQDLEATIIATGATVHVGELPRLKGDERQLAQAFQNIISNALKYRRPDIQPEVSIQSELIKESHPLFSNVEDVKKGNYHLIQISDNGIGFEQEQAEKIFKVFQRLHGKELYEGTGVGLAIVQKVIANHKGYIKAEATPERGATFYIILPAE